MLRNTTLILLLSILIPVSVKAQPIPIELMMGNRYGAVNLVFNRNFSPDSKFGFFHLNTVQFDYGDENRNSFILQDFLYYEVVRNLRVSGGVSYNKGGFSPSAGLQYVYSGKQLFFLFAPKVSIRDDYSYDFMTILQYKPPVSDKARLFTRVQLLNVFDEGGNIKSYQWVRLGLEVKGIQFGAALNFDQYGPKPPVESSFGLFVRKEIF